MRIVAALAWYREPVEFLDRCVRSLEGVADRVVALDGAWELFPGASRHSTFAEGIAIMDAAGAIGVRSHTRAPDRVWKSQVEKRAALMELASEQGDWILVVDGDEHVVPLDPDEFHRRLAKTEAVVGDVGLVNLHAGRIVPGGLARRVYRAPVTVQTVHTGYFHAGRPLYPGEPAVGLEDVLSIEHDHAARGEERNAQAAEYLRRRQSAREEVWVA